MRLTLVLDIKGTVAETKMLVQRQDAEDFEVPISIDAVDEFDVIDMLQTYKHSPLYEVHFTTKMEDDPELS